MAAVAVTAASVQYHNWGDCQAVSMDLTSVDDTDTLAAGSYGFGIVHNVIFTPTTAVVVVPSFSGTTITFLVAAGSIAGRLTIVGK